MTSTHMSCADFADRQSPTTVNQAEPSPPPAMVSPRSSISATAWSLPGSLPCLLGLPDDLLQPVVAPLPRLPSSAPNHSVCSSDLNRLLLLQTPLLASIPFGRPDGVAGLTGGNVDGGDGGGYSSNDSDLSVWEEQEEEEEDLRPPSAQTPSALMDSELYTKAPDTALSARSSPAAAAISVTNATPAHVRENEGGVVTLVPCAGEVILYNSANTPAPHPALCVAQHPLALDSSTVNAPVGYSAPRENTTESAHIPQVHSGEKADKTTSSSTFASSVNTTATTTSAISRDEPLAVSDSAATLETACEEAAAAPSSSATRATIAALTAAPAPHTHADSHGGWPTSMPSSAADPNASSRTSARAPSSIATWIRSRVSQNKIRFRESGFNLDLTYITPRIIAMGYPAHGTEHFIRNPIDEVERFFDERHRDHFRLFNLCSERSYDTAKRFHGCFRRYPFDDHNAPTLALMLDFARDAADFLAADPLNIVAVHCKAGKGRTGVMVCCLLMYVHPDIYPTAKAAIHFFDQQRTSDGAGLTIASQRRYVRYFEQLLHEYGGTLPLISRRLRISEVTVRVAHSSSIVHPADLYFVVSDHERVLLDSRRWLPNGPSVGSAGCLFVFPTLRDSVGTPVLEGDVKLAVYRRRPIVLAGKESAGCYLWFNTTLCPSLSMVFQRQALDKVDVAAMGKNVLVSITLTDVAASRDAGKRDTEMPE